MGPWSEARAILGLWRLLRLQRPSIVHLVTPKITLMAGIVARILNIPTVAAISGLGHLFVHPSIRARLGREILMLGWRIGLRRKNCIIIFQNETDRSLFVDRGIVRPENAVLIPGSGVDTQRIKPSPPLPGTPVVILPARLLYSKGVEDFVRAAEILRAKGVDARFVLVGDPDPENPASIPLPVIQAWDTQGIVEWQPFRADIGHALAQSHIVALPSHREGFPKSLVDAAAAGRPTVTTDVPGCRDAVVDGSTGLICRVSDPQDLANKLQTLIERPELREKMGKAGCELAESRYAISLIVAAHMDIYRRLVIK